MTMRSERIRPILTAWVCLLGLAIAGGNGQPRALGAEDDASFLHALLLIDTLTNIGTSVAKDKENMQRFLEEEIPAPRRSVTVLEGKDVKTENVISYYSRLDVKPNDALLFFYAGHGAWDEQQGHYLALSQSSPLFRRDLLQAMQQKKARLTAVITDTCSVIYNVSLGRFRPQLAASRVDSRIGRCLFFRQRGLIDLTSASKGFPASGNDTDGGAFTVSLLGLLYSDDLQRLDSNNDQILTWRELMEPLKVQTDQNSRRMGSDGQIPTLFDPVAEPFAQPLPRSTQRLGLNVRNTDGTGVLIAHVFPDSPAEWAGFRRNEVLFEINGQPIRDETTFAQAVDAQKPRTLIRCRTREASSTPARAERNLAVRLGGEE